MTTQNNNAVPTEVFQSKAYKKAEKLLGRTRARELVEKGSDELKSAIGQCIAEMNKREAEMKQNADYRRSADVIKTLKGGLRDTNKPEKITVDLAKAVIQARVG